MDLPGLTSVFNDPPEANRPPALRQPSTEAKGEKMGFLNTANVFTLVIRRWDGGGGGRLGGLVG